MLYRTYFELTDDVCDFEAARTYLIEDDMTKYLKEDYRCSSCKDKIISIKWILKDNNSGYIDLETADILTNDELNKISDWVTGQNSDGLGEGFEQQDFANYKPNDNSDYNEDDCDNDWVMASFDWKTNLYKFELIAI